jgi:hypothetical protein
VPLSDGGLGFTRRKWGGEFPKAEMLEDLFYDRLFFDEGNDVHLGLASRADKASPLRISSG